MMMNASIPESDMFKRLQSTADHLQRFNSETKQQEELELAQYLCKRTNDEQFYYADKFNKFRTAGAGSSTKWLPSVQAVESLAVPRAIRSLYSQIECEMLMGLLPEINRAWITIDNRLFLWNYTRGEDFLMYDGLEQLIVSVALAKPRPGVFESDLSHILVISTTVEVVILKLKRNGNDDITLEPTEYNLSSDNEPMRAIAGTVDGRIFMGGQDGSLYEFVYENPSMLHSLGLKRQCRKVDLSSSFPPAKWLVPSFIVSLANMSPDPLVELKIDHERRILYTLSKHGTITGYGLGNLGENTTKNLFRQTASQISKLTGSDPEIISLNIVREEESQTICLVAITKKGLRLYFSFDGKSIKFVYHRGPPESENLADLAHSLERDPGKSTSMLGGRQTRAHNQNTDKQDRGVPPSTSTSRNVTSSLYAGGVTLLAFASNTQQSQSQYNDQQQQQQQQPQEELWSYSLDLSMRNTAGSNFPPLKWSLPPYHEVVDVDILGQGPSPRQTVVEGDELNNIYGAAGGASLPIGQVRAMVESVYDPTVNEEEELVYAHMVHAPRPIPTTDLSSKLTTGSSSGSFTQDENKSAAVGNKRGYEEAMGSTDNDNAIKRASRAMDQFGVVPLSVLSKQHVLPRRYFLVLTSHGLWILVKNRPVHQLHALLQGPDPGTNVDIQEFFMQYGLDETCCMCLSIACKVGYEDEIAQPDSNELSYAMVKDGNPFADSSALDEAARSSWVAKRAVRWFKERGYGIIPGERGRQSTLPCYQKPGSESAGMLMNAPSSGATGSKPSNGSSSLVATARVNSTNEYQLEHSGCYKGIALLMIRFLRPIWEWSVIVDAETILLETRNIPTTHCRWSRAQIALLVTPLQRLKHFLLSEYQGAIQEMYHQQMQEAHATTHRYENGPGYSGPGSTNPSSDYTWTGARNRMGIPRIDAMSQENQTIAGLYQLLDRSIQALLLFDILQCNPNLRFARLISHLSEDIAKKLQDMSWGELITRSEGKVVACELVKIMVEKSDNTSARSIIGRLESSCPAFFSEGDALTISAFEELSMAEKAAASYEKNKHIQQALDKLRDGFKKSSPLLQVSVTKLTLGDACEKLERMGIPASGVALALYCASCYAIQPLDVLPAQQNVGEHNNRIGYTKTGPKLSSTSTSSSSSSPFPTFTNSNSASKSTGSSQNGREEKSLEIRYFCYDLALQMIERSLPAESSSQNGTVSILKTATDSKDALWHFTLYGWLLSKGLKQYLLSIESEYLPEFLGDPSANDPRRAGPGIYEQPFHVDIHLVLQADWYGRTGNKARAAAIMQYLAKLDTQYRENLNNHHHHHHQGNNVGPTLEQRIRYFTKALTYAKAAQGDSFLAAQESSAAVDTARLKDELDVADLQQKVLNSLVESTTRLENNSLGMQQLQEDVATRHQREEELESRHKDIVDLQTTLKTPSDLYNDYAYRYGLWEACIHIMKACNHTDDVEELHTMYENIIRETIWETVRELHRDAEFEELMQPIRSRLVELGQEFFNAPDSFGFPYDYLIQGLEDLSRFYPQNQSYGPREWTPWVLDIMADEIGVPYEHIFDVYANYNHRIQSSHPPILAFLTDNPEEEWYNEKSKSNVAWAIVTLVRKWRGHIRNDDEMYERVGDLLERLLVIVGGLHSEDVTESNRRKLREALNNLINQIKPN